MIMAVLAGLIVLTLFSYYLAGNRKASYEKGLRSIFHEWSCYKLGWIDYYSLPIIRHTLYEDFIVISGKGERERVFYKHIVKAVEKTLFRWPGYLLNYSITYEYLDIKEKERRSVTISTRYPEELSMILAAKGVTVER